MGTQANVLIVDDDEELGLLLREKLGRYGLMADLVSNGHAMLEWLEAHSCDLILLDIMMPGEDGLALCRKLRAMDNTIRNIPIIFTTALGDVSDRIVGLEIGADDYLPKPFDTRELVARIKTVLRRAKTTIDGFAYNKVPFQEVLNGTIRFGNWKFDISGHSLVDGNGIVVPLSATEYRLLYLFIEHPGKVLTREVILAHLGGRATENYDRSVDVQINRLRSKLRDTGKSQEIIRTIRGDGYMLDINVERI